jgi:hypothetical protein
LARTSSTSASSAGRWREWPWAGLLALLLLLAGDRWLLGSHGAWALLDRGDPDSAAGTRIELARLVAQPRERPRLAVVGTSRVMDGFDKELAQRLLPGAAIAKLGYPRFEPFAIRQLVPELAAADVDAVVLIASEQDTHRPLRLEPVPGSSAADLGALWDLMRATGWRFAVEHRTDLYRLAGTSALWLYRFRPDLRLTGLDRLQTFQLDPRLEPPGSRPRGDPFRPVALWGAERHPVAPEARRSTWDLFPPLMDQWKARIEAGTVQEITRGPHVAVQEYLYRRALEELRRAGIEVVVLQGVMHPAAADLYDTRLRADFRAWMEPLAAELGVHFVPEEQMPRFAESDFYDLVHTSHQGAEKLTRVMVDALRQTPIDWSPRHRNP